MINIAAWSIIVLSILLFIFQLSLMFGAPIGNYAWGGKHKKLPFKLRVGSFFSALIFIFSIIITLDAANIMNTFSSSFFVKIFIWIFAILFGLSLIGNINSKSKEEKKVMTPVAFVLFISYLILGILG